MHTALYCTIQRRAFRFNLIENAVYGVLFLIRLTAENVDGFQSMLVLSRYLGKQSQCNLRTSALSTWKHCTSLSQSALSLSRNKPYGAHQYQDNTAVHYLFLLFRCFEEGLVWKLKCMHRWFPMSLVQFGPLNSAERLARNLRLSVGNGK